LRARTYHILCVELACIQKRAASTRARRATTWRPPHTSAATTAHTYAPKLVHSARRCGLASIPELSVAMYTLNSSPLHVAPKSYHTRPASVAPHPPPNRQPPSCPPKPTATPHGCCSMVWSSAPPTRPWLRLQLASTHPRRPDALPAHLNAGMVRRCRRAAHLYSPAACCFWMGRKSLNSGGSSSSEYNRSLK